MMLIAVIVQESDTTMFNSYSKDGEKIPLQSNEKQGIKHIKLF